MKIEELKKSKQWLNWKRVDEGKRITKIPYCYKGYMTGADQKHSKDWCDYDTACKSNRFDGIGVAFHNGLCGIDIDHKSIDDPLVQDIISMMNTYTEISPSGNGYHLLFTVDLDRIPKRINEKRRIKTR